MNDNSTQPDTAQRNSYMTALSLAEQLISESAVLPTEFMVAARPWTPSEPELRFYFHDDIAGLRQFRDDQMLTESMETRNDGSVYIEAARDDVRGVRVTAWTLTPAAAAPVVVVTLAEAVDLMGALPMPTAGDLAEQRHLVDPLDHTLEHLADDRPAVAIPAQRAQWGQA